MTTQTVSQLQEIIEAQKTIINTQREKLQWWEDLHSNGDLTPNMRETLIAVKKLQAWAEPDEEGAIFAHLPTLAGYVHTSPSSISRGLLTLARSTDVLEHRSDPIPGEPHKHTVHIKIASLIDNPKEIKLMREIPQHGGKRIKQCEKCHSTNLIEEKTIICQDCHYKHKPTRRDVNAEALSDIANGDWTFDVDTYMNEPDPEKSESFHHETGNIESSDEETPTKAESFHLESKTVDTGVSCCNVLPPAELRALPIWCPWRYEEPEKPRADGKQDKVPYQTRGRAPQKASVSDATTWTTYDQAQAIYEQSLREGWKRSFDGIGFMCDGSFVGIDLDHCRNKETGEIAAWAQAIIDRFASYWYITPSEEGVRIVIRAEKPGPRCKNGDKEIYEEKRFFTWTPMQVPGTPETIADRQDELTAFYAETFPEQAACAEVRQPARVFTPSCPCSDDEVLSKARGAANGPKFRRLYDECNITGYASQSEAELALCRMLVYYSDGDEDAIDRLMRQWKLFRPEKWDRAARSGETYGQGTIRVALGESIAS